MELTQQNKTDLLEVVIILAMFFLIIVIYVPVAIWEEEEYYQDLSRYRMQNVYDIESFYKNEEDGILCRGEKTFVIHPSVCLGRAIYFYPTRPPLSICFGRVSFSTPSGLC